ncbi:MAG: hypothetical protein EZS28_025847 [Streblomastix strix]|uniref:Vid27 PH-like domain-containing protein n=1 Tax=Streblomastix strix TaxID=222440 RepID=A0A5J4V866_9EUKA|nr:MAG: hypothetical protein EZS28_025847 [Streblomastix strix]
MENPKKIIEVDAELFTLNIQSGHFVIVDAEARLGICSSGSIGEEPAFKYDLAIHNKKGKILLLQRINSEMHLYFKSQEKSIIWAVPFEDTVLTLNATIKEPVDGTGGESAYELLRREFAIRLWEAQNKLPFSKCEDAECIIKSSTQNPPVSLEKEKEKENNEDEQTFNETIKKEKKRKR